AVVVSTGAEQDRSRQEAGDRQPEHPSRCSANRKAREGAQFLLVGSGGSAHLPILADRWASVPAPGDRDPGGRGTAGLAAEVRASAAAVPDQRSRTPARGRTMAGPRARCRATGLTDDDFAKPIVAIANSYSQFGPGHVHLKDMGDIVPEPVRAAGGATKE